MKIFKQSKFLSLLTKRDKLILSGLLVSSLAVSVIETLSISVVMLFVSMATDFGMIQKSRYGSWIYKLLGFRTPVNFIITLGFTVIAFYVVRGFLNIVHIWAINKFTCGKSKRFATEFFNTYLNFEYKDFAIKNSSAISQEIFTYTGNYSQVLLGFLMLASESFTILCVYGMLFWVNWRMTLVLTCILSVLVFAIIKTFSKRIAAAGKSGQKFNLEIGKTFSESFWNFKIVRLMGIEDRFIKRFDIAEAGMVKTQLLNAMFQNIPRFLLETIGFFILVSMILYVIFSYHNPSLVTPIVSMYALAFYRFLPSVNKIIISYNQIAFNKHAIEHVYNFKRHAVEHIGQSQVRFTKTIEVKNLAFGYQPQKLVLTGASLVINKGERVGFVGESGAGKSTLVDLIAGLYKPVDGYIQVDSIKLTDDNLRSWRNKIGYIPQTIYLFDGTVAENIVFGREYDEEKIITALQKSNIYEFLIKHQDGIHTKVGEGGIKLSGGQKQRIAIARALYSDPEILILDEATSSLDNQTEERIMEEIYNVEKDKTLLIIAHRLTTVERCDKIYKLENGVAMLTQIKAQENKITPTEQLFG